MEPLGKRIAFLCTGDEIVSGEILDTNAPYFSQLLISENFSPGTRLIVSDNQDVMVKGIRYLLQDHAVLITLGGLGPTSDDRTRFALSEAIGEPLLFDQDCWERIINMLSQLNVEIPENNQRQCLFPANAEIYPNAHGTASACCINKGQQLIFMLPGPPNECRPIFSQYILPRLLKTDLQQDIYRCSWMLLGTSEGKIAKELDTLVKKSDCDIGYRVSYPYVEVKLQSIDKNALEALIPQIEFLIKDQLVSRNKRTASELFLEYIQSSKETFSIIDHATQGRFATTLLWPEVYNRLNFRKIEADIEIKLEGLTAYWEQQNHHHAQMPLTVHKNGKIILKQIINVPIRGWRTPSYAVELACECCLKALK